ncbi:MAG: histidine phosphatase family protein [Flavobacteriales bacterium]|nr:histidine phosphatase family protein [Flavobacteriales bacterium]
MKTLHLIRHFKSDWSGDWSSDFERKLNDRGRSDIPVMAEKLKHAGADPQAIFHSAAVRTTLTCQGLLHHCNWRNIPVQSVSEFYGAGIGEFMHFIDHLDDRYSEVMLIGHNPTMTDLINYLSKARLDNLPTGGWAEIRFDVASWKDLRPKSGSLVELDFPKNRS